MSSCIDSLIIYTAYYINEHNTAKLKEHSLVLINEIVETCQCSKQHYYQCSGYEFIGSSVKAFTR